VLTVKTYKDGKVYIKKSGSYSVGELSQNWKQKSVGAKAINFYNKELGSSIATSAFCGDLFEDRTSKVLTGQLNMELANQKIISQEKIPLNERGATRTISMAELDGVPFKLDTVVISKDYCVFDFICVTPIEKYEEAVKDFETFFGGFQY
jgi:hypothetical protein